MVCLFLILIGLLCWYIFKQTFDSSLISLLFFGNEKKKKNRTSVIFTVFTQLYIDVSRDEQIRAGLFKTNDAVS